MRLVKSLKDGKCVLTFEISPIEAAAAGVNMDQLWESKSLAEFVAALSKMTKQTTAEETFAEKLRRTQEILQGQQQYRPLFGTQYNGRVGQAFTQIPPEPEWTKILGVKANASKEEIKSRYRTLVKENHPDRGGDPVKFAKISEAYEQATK